MKKTLYPHQLEAVEAVRGAIKAGETPYLDLCVSFGKSLVMAHISNECIKRGGRVLQITPTQELCSQNALEAIEYIDSPEKLGILCAGLNKKQTLSDLIVCTYGSMLSNRTRCGAFDIVLIDECQTVNPNPDTSIQKILKSLLRLNPKMKTIGFSGSPYRLDQGMLHMDCIKGPAFFTSCAYVSDISWMIKEGYLSHVESISGNVQADMSGVKMSGGDFNNEMQGVKFDAIASAGVDDMREKFAEFNIKTAVIFASTVKNARHIASLWHNQDEIRVLTGDTGKAERKQLIQWLKSGEANRYVVNVGILTTGFNFPALDCVTFFRATTSLSLYVQCVGRVIRAHKDKSIGYVLDYGSNIERLGPIDKTLPPRTPKRRSDAPKKICDITLDSGIICNTINILSAKKCKSCGAHFMSENEDGKYSMVSAAEILAKQEAQKVVNIDIYSTEIIKAFSRKDGTEMIKIKLFDEDISCVYEHYLCLDHKGFARDNSRRFLRSMFKNQADYFKLGIAGLSVDNVIKLMQDPDIYDNFFRIIKSIKIKPQLGNKKYMQLVSASYK